MTSRTMVTIHKSLINLIWSKYTADSVYLVRHRRDADRPGNIFGPAQHSEDEILTMLVKVVLFCRGHHMKIELSKLMDCYLMVDATIDLAWNMPCNQSIMQSALQIIELALLRCDFAHK